MRIPYGFTLTNNGTLEINRSDADNVALVFDLYMAGASLGKVADMLFSKHRLRLERQNGLVPR